MGTTDSPIPVEPDAPVGKRPVEEELRSVLAGDARRYDELFEHTNDVVYTHDLAGNFLSVNQAGLLLTGYSRDELMASKVVDIVVPEHVELANEMIRQMLAGRPTATFQVALMTKHGDRPVLEVNSRLLYRGGRAIALQGIGRDITERLRVEAALRESEQRFRSVFDGAAIGIMRLDLRGNCLESNRAMQAMLGYDAEELTSTDLSTLLHPDDRAQAVERFRETIRGRRDHDQFELRYLRKDGSVVWTQATVSLGRDVAGEPLFCIGMMQDVSQRREAEQAMQRSEARFRSLIQNISDIIALLDANGRVLYISPSFQSIWGLSPEALIGVDFFLAMHPEDVPRVRSVFAAVVGTAGAARTVEFRRPDRMGGYRYFEAIMSNLLNDPEVGGVVINTREITDRKRSEEALKHQALHDALTELPNRTLLQDRLDQAIRAAQRERTPLALLFLDLDRFKDVNDTFGHHMGDRLLQQGGARLRAAIRAVDTVARLGGDEFAVLLPATGREGAQLVAEKIVLTLSAPYNVDGLTLDVGTSIGIALFPEQGQDAGTLMRRADVAMYVAKRSGGGVAVYSADQDLHSRERMLLITELREAIEQRELILHFQPVVALAGKQQACFEALVRWQHPRYGLMQPDQFVPLAEQSGLLVSIGHHVLSEALQQCATWQRSGMEVGVAVNLSGRGLHDPGLPQLIARLLSEHGLPPNRLTLEITEAGLITNPQVSREALVLLHDMGVRLSIDDFGTGYSSLSQLSRLPVDEIKIDRSFVLRMMADENDAVIVRSTIELAHNLGLCVVAAGIEDENTLERLRQLSCDFGQGYLLGRPLPVGDVPSWLSGYAGGRFDPTG